MVSLGQIMEKEQQCSDWGLRPLSPAQIKYAAEDALCARRLFLYFVADLVTQLDPLICDNHIWGPWLVRERPRDQLMFLQESNVLAAVEALGLGSKDGFLPLPAENTPSAVLVKTVALVIHSPESDPSYVAVVIDITRTINMTQLTQSMCISHESHIALASNADLLHVFGYGRGCIGPVGLRQQCQVTIILDTALMDMEVIYCGAGTLGRVVALSPRALMDVKSDCIFVCSHAVSQ
ncbi:Aste57867_24609 [Aphanomyces stellatus]|uniref:Aste57867_24609 protein n=1 Tax=Aphanomyces stellatus TaxID=120398 RepID=A0A485LRX4_9STRA|nr:hypothetical protein As57867_024531 [Aphanomyces stellatus]VFU01247.1 Aste57867_24609 [Aphanomyces stellatus]